jgi:membrane protein YqaA with SNARE-associated domain
MTEGTTSTTPAAKRGLFRALYDWTMANATGRHAWTALFCLSFAESSFFPMPPDILLIPMVLADRRRAFLIALVCTIGSVLGGMLGYAIGSLLFNSVGQWLISVYGSGDLDAFRAAYAKWGQWIILLQGLTPIPYKIVSIATGFAAFPFATFVLMSAITRGFRYFTEAGLLYLFGDPIRAFIEKRFMLTLIVAFAVIVLGFVMVRYAF